MLSDGVWAFRGCSQELAALVRLLKHHSLISFLFLSFSIFSVLGFEFRASHL
jgi:nitrate reductase NapE component